MHAETDYIEYCPLVPTKLTYTGIVFSLSLTMPNESTSFCKVPFNNHRCKVITLGQALTESLNVIP